MNFQETINYLYEQLPMYSRIGAAAYKNDLTNTLALCEFLGNPHKKIKTIHIAGTNGKGSTSHMLAAILQKSGYKTGLYTSPHLVDFRERIRINGEMIDPNFIVDFVERSKAITQSIKPSFFELTVAMAFDFFHQSEVEVAIIETGLGGRLDSTNVIIPELSIITNIGFDHMNLLGNTLAKIAFEKAGIIKQNVPVIIGAYLPETRPVFIEKAMHMQSSVIFAEDDFNTEIISSDDFLLKCLVNDCANHQSFEYTIDLPGLYQYKNLNTVFAAVQQLNKIGYEISHQDMQSALLNVKSLTGLGGRWECIGVNPTIILEVAHNEDGIRNVMQQIQHPTATHFVLGMVRDKEIDKVLELFPAEANYYFTQAAIPRALPAEELMAKAIGAGLKGQTYLNVNDAIAAAKMNAQSEDVILVLGSVFLVGEVAR